MFELVAIYEVFERSEAGGPWERTKLEGAVATFDDDFKAYDYIKKSKLPEIIERENGSRCSFSNESLLRSAFDADVREIKTALPHNPPNPA